MRPLTLADEPRIRRAYATADPRALRLRFGGAAPSFPSLARRLREMDGHSRFAVGAFAPDGGIVGVAQYVQSTPGGPADVAVLVVPSWQRQGVGSALLTDLQAHAVAEGITSATALVSGSNTQVQEVLRDLTTPHTVTYDHGSGDVRVDLTANPPLPPGAARR